MGLRSIITSVYPISNDIFDDLKQSMDYMSYPKGYTLSKEGEIERYLYFLEKGVVRAFTLRDGEEITFWFGMEGSIVCSMRNYIENKPSYETIELLEDSTLYRIPIEKMELYYEKNIEMANWGRKYIEYEIIKTENRLIEQLFLSATERYHALIKNNPAILQRVSLGHIASYLGITQVSLSRIRAKM